MAIVVPSVSSDDFTAYREGRGIVHRYISPIPRRIVLEANAAVITRDLNTNGIYELELDFIVTGTTADALAGYTIDVGNSPGSHNIGQLRVRKLSGISDKLYVSETAPGEVPIVFSNSITVREERRPWYRFPYIQAFRDANGYLDTFIEYTDYDEAYAAQNSDIQPQANILLNSSCHPARPAGFHDLGQSYRTVTLYAGKSRFYAEGATLGGYLWDVGDGTIISGTATSETIVVRFPASNYFRYISLTVEDSNGTTHTQYFPIMVHGYGVGQTPPIENFSVTRESARIDGGHEMDFEFWGADGSMTEDDFPSGCGFVYWEEMELGEDGEEAPSSYIGSYMGWVLSEKTEYKLFDSSIYRIVTGGIASWLERFRSFGQTIRDTGELPETHSEMEDLTVDKAAHYALRRYTNAPDICNIFEAGAADIVKAIDLKDGSAWSQVKDVMTAGRLSTVGADALNGIWMRRDYRYMTLLERSSTTPLVTITKPDWMDEAPLSMEIIFTQRVGSVKGAGAGRSDTDAEILVAAIAPGKKTGPGLENIEMPVQYLPFVNTQAILNRLTGMYYAVQNSPYPDFNLKLNFPFRCIEPCWMLPIEIEWEDEDIRDKTFSAQFIITSIDVTHSNEFGEENIQISWGLTRCISGNEAEEVEIEDTTTTTDQPPPPASPPYDPGVLGQGTRKIAIFYTDNKMRVTVNFTATRPTYITTDLSLLANWGGGTIVDFTVDAFSYATSQVDGYITTTTHWQPVFDIFGTTTLGAAVALTDNTVARCMNFERNVNNLGLIPSYKQGVGVRVARTTNGTSIAGQVLAGSESGTGGDIWTPGLALSAHTSGKAFSSRWVGSGGGSGCYTYTGSDDSNFELVSGLAVGDGFNGNGGTGALEFTVGGEFTVDSVEMLNDGSGITSLSFKLFQGGIEVLNNVFYAGNFSGSWTDDPQAYGGSSTVADTLIVYTTGNVYAHDIEICVTPTGGGGSAVAEGMATIDSGANWVSTNALQPSGGLATSVHAPYANTSMSKVYYGSGAANARRLKRSISGTAADISPTHSANTYGVGLAPEYGNRAITSSDMNENVIFLFGFCSSNSHSGVFRSGDGGNTWTVPVTPSATMPYRGGYVSGDNPNLLYMLGINGAVALLDGMRVLDKKNYTTTGTAVGLCGG